MPSGVSAADIGKYHCVKLGSGWGRDRLILQGRGPGVGQSEEGRLHVLI